MSLQGSQPTECVEKYDSQQDDECERDEYE